MMCMSAQRHTDVPVAAQDYYQTKSGEGNGYCCGEKAVGFLAQAPGSLP